MDMAVGGFSIKAKELNSPDSNLPVVGMITVVTKKSKFTFPCSSKHRSNLSPGVLYHTLVLHPVAYKL